jgi:hypothetical protein
MFASSECPVCGDWFDEFLAEILELWSQFPVFNGVPLSLGNAYDGAI